MYSDIERIEKFIKEECIKYYEFSEFSETKEISSEMYKANWKQSETCIALRTFNLEHATVKEIIREIKLRREVDFNNMMMKFYGITKTSDKKYLLILEYAEGSTLRNYLKEEFTSLNWQDKYGLAFQLSSAIEYLHEKEIIHENLNSSNIFIQQNSIKLADFGLSKRIKSTDQISFDTVPYDAPEGCNTTGGNLQDVNRENKQIKKLKKSDVYSIGILLWELSSGKRPFVDREYNISLAREIAQGLRESIVEGTPKEYSNLYSKCWDGDPDKRPTIQEVVIILKSLISLQQTRQMIKQLKLNHGLFLDGYRIEPSKQAVLSENGILNISLYREQPLVYTCINDHGSHTNLLSFSLDYNNELTEALQPSDICINFPVAEITYNAGLLESFSNFMEGDEALYETYGHLFARKLLVGGTLFIDDFKSITSKQQIDSFKSLLTWIYNSVKYNRENPFNNLSLNFFPKLRTSCGGKLHAPEDLINWMNKLYQDNMLDVISYTNLILISELRLGKSSSIDSFQEKQPGIINFKEKLSLDDWVSDSIYVNLERWVKEFHLLQGIIINEYLSLEISKKTAVSFVNVPSVYSDDIFHLDMIKPKNNLEKILILNSIFPTENARDISTFPFIKGLVKDDNLDYQNYIHFLARRERYKILLNSFDIKPSEEFKLAIEEALESMRPFEFLQNVFDEYGHLFPITIVLGKSLKNILPRSSKKTYLESPSSPTLESLKLHLDNLNLSYLLTQKGNIVEKNDLSNWIQNKDKDFEIIGFENVISLYDILEIEQRRKIDIVLNKQDEVKIIMTGTVDLEDLDNNNIEHYKRINVQPSLESENYEVFGSIISDNDLRSEDFSVTFGLYDLNGFSATIKTLNNTSVNITECYILWIIVGNPSELSVFSPKNRDIKVNYVKESIELQPGTPWYPIKTCQLSEGHTIFLNYYCLTANYEPIDIKVVKWSNDYIGFQIVESNNSNTNNSNDDTNIETAAITVDVYVCILSSDYKSLIVDNEEKECYLNLIGYILTEKNYEEEENGHIFITREEEKEKDKIEYIKSFESRVFRILSKLKEVLREKSERKGGLMLSKLKKFLEENSKGGEIGSILSKLNEILGGNIEEEPIFEEVSTTEEVSIIEKPATEEKPSTEKKVPNTDNTNNAEDAGKGAANADKKDIFISDNADAVVNEVNNMNDVNLPKEFDDMSSPTIEHALPLFTPTNDEHLDLIGKIPIKKYEAILKILGNNESNITHNYALKETITLMENLAGSSKKDIEKGMKHFVPKAAVHISNLQWQYYGDSIARLELILRAMSSVLHILSNFVNMIEADTRTSLYKSVSKLWAIYRNSKCINANIVFSLREIRNCLRLIKDDQSIRPNVQVSVENITNVIQNEYASAFTSFIQILNFEYATGEWYYDWRSIRNKYFKLRKKSSRNNFKERIISFYKELIRLSDEEFIRVERKNTKYRNLEYNVLKSGGAMINCSLPDHIDTLLLGYLHLIQRFLEEFFPQIRDHDKEIVSLCNKIIQKNIKKQLTFKAIEILYIIYVVKGNVENEYFKRLITYNFSQPPQFKPNNFLIVSPPSFQFNNPPESTASDFTSFSTPPQSPPSLSIEENQNRQNKISSVRKFTTHFQRVQSFSVTRTFDIIDDVIKLFDDRRKTGKNICEIETEFKKLLNNNKTVDENLLSKLKKILEKKAPPSPYEPSTPSPNKRSIFSFFSLPKKKVKNKKSKEDEEIVKNYGKGSDNNTISSVNTEDVEKESIEENEKIEENVINSIVREVKESEKIEENVVNSIVGKVKESEKIEENVINSIVGKEKENEKVEENAEESEIFEGENVEEGENFEENAEENEKVKESDEENAEESDKVKESEQVEEENEETEKVEESDKAEEENAQGSDNVDEENAEDNESKNNNTTNFVSIEKINEKIKGQNVEKDKNLEESGNNNISIIITEEEEEKEKVEKENVEKINQEKTHLNIINHYTVNHIIQTQQTQPEQPEQPEPEPPISPIFNTIKKVIKEIEIIVDKAAKAHKEAVLKSANNSSTSVNVISEEKK